LVLVQTLPDRAFEQGLDHERDEEYKHHRFDPVDLLEEQGRGAVDGRGLGVASRYSIPLKKSGRRAGRARAGRAGAELAQIKVAAPPRVVDHRGGAFCVVRSFGGVWSASFC
jgi:hypothetical protein